MDPRRVLYQRELPGGGFVHVEEETAHPGSPHRGHVLVERRTDPVRRSGHTPPVIATAEGASAQSVFRQLLEIATDNVAIARALLRWQSDGKARF
jgi:IS5 family transposase